MLMMLFGSIVNNSLVEKLLMLFVNEPLVLIPYLQE